jgi:hypothetical protein
MDKGLDFWALSAHLISDLRLSDVLSPYTVDILRPVEFVTEVYHEASFDANPVIAYNISLASFFLLCCQ